jgi:ribosomal-protein-alanine N-acetyltransferase
LEARIDEAGPGDLDTLHAVARRSFLYPWSRAQLEAELARPWSRVRVVRARDGEVLGYAVAWIVAGEIQLLDLAVDPAARGQGLGRQLVEDLQCVGRAEGAQCMTLEVRRSNRVAIGLYRSLGFHCVGERPGYYRGEVREDALLMEWRP